MKSSHIIVITLFSFFLITCNDQVSEKKITKSNKISKKIFYIDSYHEDYSPNQKTRKAFENQFSDSVAKIKYAFLNAKNIKDTEILKNSGKSIFKNLKEFKPDVVVLSDDAAMKFIAEPFLITSNIPLVFIGVNWQYISRTENMTGQLEVELMNELISKLKEYSLGNKIGILTANQNTDLKSLRIYKDILNINFEKEYLVSNFSDWKKSFKKLQNEVDLLILRQNSGIENWNDEEAKRLIYNSTKIPTGSPNLHMNPFVLLCYPKMNEEYGEYAGKTVKKIFSGSSPSNLPIEKNIRSNITINTKIAAALNIVFPSEFLDIANLVPEKKYRVALINSYHKNYEWSDGIQSGLLKTLKIKDPINHNKYENEKMEIRQYFLDAKNNPQPEFQKKRAKEVYHKLQTWSPDFIISSDDAAAKWLIVPYFKDKKIPVLYCGINWNAKVYGFPTPYIKGMIEAAPVKELYDFLNSISKGSKTAYLGANILSVEKEMDNFKLIPGIKFSDGKLVKTVEEWKNAFLELQTSNDNIILLSPMGIKGWDKDEIKKFTEKNTQVPTGTTLKLARYYSLLTFARLPEEHGLWIGKRLNDLCNGISISEIDTTISKSSMPFVNQEIVKKLGIELPSQFMDTVFFVE